MSYCGPRDEFKAQSKESNVVPKRVTNTSDARPTKEKPAARLQKQPHDELSGEREVSSREHKTGTDPFESRQLGVGRASGLETGSQASQTDKAASSQRRQSSSWATRLGHTNARIYGSEADQRGTKRMAPGNDGDGDAGAKAGVGNTGSAGGFGKELLGEVDEDREADGEAEDDEEPQQAKRSKANELGASALKDMFARGAKMMRQVEGSGRVPPIEFSSGPVEFNASSSSVQRGNVGSWERGPGDGPQNWRSHIENLKGSGSSLEGKKFTKWRKYRSILGEFEEHNLLLNTSDTTRRGDNDRDTTDLFYAIARKGFAMNNFRESPRVEQDLPGFVDNAAHELNVSSWVNRQHSYANAVNDMKRKLAKVSRNLTTPKARTEPGQNVDDKEGMAGANDVEDEAQAARASPSKKRRRDTQDENVSPRKKACAVEDVIEID
ncbi:hypothetical protein AURDEDRAFT_174516 [Auricularia subglabra TFB-10046 SS5]|uniref:Uncharacterized protein n=1 Tax=Auricularia subglabra (strain TFB-10046 / SS5) TaxID=717982 RepID=J0WSY5_AURST|nr:hypothetical protein AURDEDRAFT_174516 [Auricularia subglabra TFB-10046 SS5]